MSTTDTNCPRPITIDTLKSRKSEGTKIVALTAYDYTFARLFDSKVDILLVGDSLGMVVQGNPNTLSVTLDEMIYHSQAVARGALKSHIVADMPFLSYQVSAEKALENAGALLARGKAHAVKVEGGVAIAATVRRMVEIGIPVMGHIGLTPQSIHQLGGFKIQGKSQEQQDSLFKDALAIEAAGAYAIVLESLPSFFAKQITSQLKIPTIGIGAGPDCDGQILVSYDLLGMNPEFRPRFIKNYAPLASVIQQAVSEYAQEVQSGAFPKPENSF